MVLIVLLTGVLTLAFGQQSVTLTVWCWTYQQAVIKADLPGFHKLYPNINIKFKIMPPSVLYQNLLLALSSGRGAPDIAGIENSHLQQFIDTGGLLNITKLAKPYYNDFVAYKWVDAEKNGQIYAMPWDAGPVAFFYRRDVFKKAGLPSDPQSVEKLLATWEGFYNVAKIIKEKTGDYMFALGKTTNDARIFEMLLQQQKTGYFNREGDVIIENPSALRILEFFHTLWEANLVQNTTPWTNAWYAGMANGKVAGTIEAVWMGGFLKSWIAPKTSGLWGVVPLPAWEKGSPRTSNDGGSSLVITNQSKEKEAAWDFISYITANKNAQLTAWEVEDSFPALKSTYETEFAKEPSQFFGGEHVRELFASLAQQIPSGWYYTANYSLANSIMSAQIGAYASGKITAIKALENAADQISRRTGLKIIDSLPK